MTADRVTRLEDAIRRLVDEIRKYAEVQGRPERVAVPHPPANPGALTRFEEYVGRRLPDSYRVFLRLHDGFTRLAFPGDMLRIADMMPPSAVHARIAEWKNMTAQHGGGEVLDGVVIADQTEPNHWVYLDPNVPTTAHEWEVVFRAPGDDARYPDLVAYFESRIRDLEACRRTLERRKRSQ